MTNLPSAPLIYTLAIIRFTPVPRIQRFASEFHDLIRKQYPIAHDEPLKTFTANIRMDDGDVTVSENETRMLQFVSPDKKWGILLNDEVFALHTIDYHDHKDFISRFKSGLAALLKVQNIGIEWLQAIGLRYVDLVVPINAESLTDYLQDWVLPPQAPESIGKIREGLYIASYETTAGTLRFQSLRNPPDTLPPDLNTGIVQMNNWKPSRPDKEFAVMDMDHACFFETIIPMNIELIEKKLFQLRAISKELFERTGTDYAMQVWKGDE